MKLRKAEFPVRHSRETRPVPIVADAALSTRGVHGGRMLPLLLLDTSDRPDIAEYIRLQESMGPGDFRYQWGQIEGHEGTVALLLTFIRPMELFFVLEFAIVRQGILVEQALTGEGMYLTKAEGLEDRFKYDVDRPKVILEVGDVGFRKIWDELFYKHVTRDFRDRGLSRGESRRAARSAIEELKKIGNMRMRDIRD